MRELARTAAAVERHGMAASLVYLDLDGFNAVNDRFGQSARDVVLKSCAERFVGLVREWALWEAQDAAARTADQELLDGRWPHWPHDESMWENSVHFVSSTGSALPAGCHFPQLHFCNDDVDCNGAMAELQ